MTYDNTTQIATIDLSKIDDALFHKLIGVLEDIESGKDYLAYSIDEHGAKACISIKDLTRLSFVSCVIQYEISKPLKHNAI
jgi:hypothetical protein